MRIGIVDADLIGRKKHRFPNLACEKISAYWKNQGADVELCLSYDNLDSYDQVFISKVFTDTPVPDNIRESDRIHMGGTGFYFDKAPPLPYEIEHQMPDYHLYDDWIESQGGGSSFKEYTDYSIGFLTRGCFRKCKFCVNQKYNKVFKHSPLSEFVDNDRKKICLLDDNFLGYSHWKEELTGLMESGKPFRFKQGLDERILTDEKCEMLFHAKYAGDFTFAFDNVSDYDIIEKKLKMIRQHTDSKSIKFYVLVGFESTDAKDIENAFIRIKLLMKYGCLPYIMRYQSKDSAPWKESEYRGIYITLARWCNQPSFFKKKSFREFCQSDAELGVQSSMRYLIDFEQKHPSIAERYFDLKFNNNFKEDIVMASKKTAIPAESQDTVDYSEKNVFQKLQVARQKFLQTGMKKSGKNMALEFMYFELADIVPVAESIFSEVGLLMVPRIVGNEAQAVVHNVDDPAEMVEFIVPYTPVQPNRGTNEMMATGSSITYIRRYLWMVVLDIIENDSIDANAGSDAPAEKKKPTPATGSAPVEKKPKANKPVTEEKRAEIKHDLTAAPADQASADQIKNLKAMLKELMALDPEQESFVQSIAVKTEGFQKITADACDKLFTGVGEMMAAYNKEG